MSVIGRYLPGMERKKVTCQPTVTLLVKRIPSHLTQTGLDNLFRHSLHFMSARLVTNKGGSCGIRGVNYAYVTYSSAKAADQAIKEMNDQPPLQLELTYLQEAAVKENNETVDKSANNTSEVKLDKGNKNISNVISPILPDNSYHSTVNSVECPEKPVCQEVIRTLESPVFTFGPKLLIQLPSHHTSLGQCQECIKPANVVCSRCSDVSLSLLIGYCSQRCQVANWPAHQVICGKVMENEDYQESEKRREIKEQDINDISLERVEILKQNIINENFNLTSVVSSTSKPELVNHKSNQKEHEHFSTIVVIPKDWTRLVRIVPVENNRQMLVWCDAGGPVVVQLSGVELAVDWTEEVKMVLRDLLMPGEGRKQRFWVRGAGKIGEIQEVDIRDEEHNDIATELVTMGIMKNIDSEVGSDVIMASLVPSLNLPGGSLVHMLDVGQTSDWWQVSCVDQPGKSKLESLLQSTDQTKSLDIDPPLVGQLVIARHRLSLVRAGVLKINTVTRQVKLQCLDIPDRPLVSFSNLFFPPVTCHNHSALCRLVKVAGVPSRIKLVAVEVLRKLQPPFLQEDLQLYWKGEEVELLNREGISINNVLNEIFKPDSGEISGENNQENNIAKLPFTVPTVDLSDPACYQFLPLNEELEVNILYLDSKSNIFVCRSSLIDDLNQFQRKLQGLKPEFWKRPTEIQASKMVVVWLDKFSAWYRAVVIKVYGDEFETVRLYCPDFGYIEKVSTNHTRQIEELGLIETKMFASRCNLHEGQEMRDKIQVGRRVMAGVLGQNSVRYIIKINRVF